MPFFKKKIFFLLEKERSKEKNPAHEKFSVLFDRIHAGYFWFAMNKFTINEALTRLEDGNWHSVAYVTADINKKTGGKIVRIKECKLLQHDNLQGVTGDDENVSGNLSLTKNKTKRRQNHSRNATRNLRLRNNLIRKVHIYTLFAVDKIPVL